MRKCIKGLNRKGLLTMKIKKERGCMMSTTTITILLTATFVLLTTIVQMLIYVHFRKREKLKEYNQINQELVFPYLNEVLLYIEMQTDRRKEHGIEMIHIHQDQLITKIHEKANLGNSKLLNALFRYFKTISYFEGHGEGKNLATYEVLFYYLEHAFESIKYSNYADKDLLDNIKTNEKIVGIAFVLTSLIGKDEAIKILSHKWLWSTSFLKEISTDLLGDLISNYNSSKMDKEKLLMFLSTINNGFFESTEEEQFPELKGYIDEAMLIVNQRWVNYTY